LGTLAAAYAEAGQFSQAINTQNRVLEILAEKGTEAQKAEHRKRLEVYEAGTSIGKKREMKRPVKETSAVAALVEKTKPKPLKPMPPVSGGTAPPPLYPYTIQISSYREGKMAFGAAMRFKKKGDPTYNSVIHIPTKGGDWHRLFFGFYENFDDASNAAEILKQRKFRHVSVVKKPYAVQIGRFNPDGNLTEVEKKLYEKSYLPYSIADGKSTNSVRLLIGAYGDKASAQRQLDLLSAAGFSPELVKR
jgi:hypothetical protein